MKLYCFLLLIIFIYLIYDTNLYEGANGKYDTKGDATFAYKKPSEFTDEESILSKLGLPDFIPTEYMPDELKELSNTKDINCKELTKNGCASSNYVGNGHNYKFPYGSKNMNDNKKKCMDCLKCKDEYAFIDEFYSNLCDAIAGCYENPPKYNDDTMAYAYALVNTDWANGCSLKERSKNKLPPLNPLQKITCSLMINGGAPRDMIMLYKKGESALCHAKIAALELRASVSK